MRRCKINISPQLLISLLGKEHIKGIQINGTDMSGGIVGLYISAEDECIPNCETNVNEQMEIIKIVNNKTTIEI